MDKMSDGSAVDVDNKAIVMGQRHEGTQGHDSDNMPMDASEAPEGAVQDERHPGTDVVKKDDVQRVPTFVALGVASALISAVEKKCPGICAHAPSFLPGVACSFIPESHGDEDLIEAALVEGCAAVRILPRLTEDETLDASTQEGLLMIVGPLQRHALAIWAIAELLTEDGYVHAHVVEDAMRKFGGNEVGMTGPSPELLRESSGEPLPKVPRENVWIIHKAAHDAGGCGAHSSNREQRRAQKK